MSVRIHRETYDQDDDGQDGVVSGAHASTRSDQTVSTSPDTLPSYRTSAHVPISGDELVSGEGSISSGVREPSARATSSDSSPSESTQRLLDSLTSVRPIAPHETPEGFRRQLGEGSDIGFGLAEETYHPPVTDEKVDNEMTREEYDSVYRCVPLAFVFDNCPCHEILNLVALLVLWQLCHCESSGMRFSDTFSWQLFGCLYQYIFLVLSILRSTWPIYIVRPN